MMKSFIYVEVVYNNSYKRYVSNKPLLKIQLIRKIDILGNNIQ